MRTFKAYFKKEILESWRQYRYLVLTAGFVLFAILDPLMLKMMPHLLKNQVPPEMVEMLFVFTPTQAAQNFIKDVYQLVNLFVILSLMSIYSDEIYGQKLVLPFSKGTKVAGMVLARFTHYAVTIFLISMLSFMLNTYYIHLIIGGQGVQYLTMLQVSLFISVYYIFTIAFLFFLSSVTKKGIVAGIIVLLFNYTGSLFLQIPAFNGWLPHTLIVQANHLGSFDSALVTKTILIVIGYVVVLQWLTIQRLKRVEVV